MTLVRRIDIVIVIQNSYRYELGMTAITISPKFQVVIPKQIRDTLHLKPGQRIQAILYENRIELIPVRPVDQMRGFLKGIDTHVEREPDRV